MKLRQSSMFICQAHRNSVEIAPPPEEKKAEEEQALGSVLCSSSDIAGTAPCVMGNVPSASFTSFHFATCSWPLGRGRCYLHVFVFLAFEPRWILDTNVRF